MSLRILLVEDNNDDAELIRHYLHGQMEGEVLTQVVWTEDGMRKALEEPWDAILCDYNIPNFQWPRPFIIAQMMKPAIPFIVISGVFGEDLIKSAKTAFVRGVDGFLSKSELSHVGDAVSLIIRGAEAIAERDKAVHRLRNVLSLDEEKKED